VLHPPPSPEEIAVPTTGQPTIARPAAARRAALRRSARRRSALRRSALRRSTHRRAAVVGSAAAVTALALGGVVAPVAQAAPAAFDPTSCVPDYSPPTITAFGFSPKKVNVKKGSKSLSVTARATDTQGVASMTAIFASPKKGKKQSFAAATLKRTGGSSTNGTFTGKAKVNRWVIPGAWKVSSVIANDTKGAAAFLDYNGLGAKKWSRDLKVVSTPDLKAPRLTSFTLAPTKVSTTSKAATVRVTAKAKDKQSGVMLISATLTKAGQKNTVTASLKRTKGSANNGTFSGTVTIPRWVGNAKWAASAQVTDAVGNTKSYTNAQLKKKKWKRAVTVKSGVDSVAPTVAAFSFSPRAIDSGNGPASVNATATLKDAASGVASASITWTGPSGYQKLTANLSRVSGSPASGTWKGKATTPCYAEAGVWKASATVTDVAGNTRHYTAAQLEAAGHDTELTVTMTF